MALNTSEMWSKGIKIAFYFKNLQKIAQRMGLRPKTPRASGGGELRTKTVVCDAFELHQLTRHVSQVRHFHFLTISLPLLVAKSWLIGYNRPPL